MRLATDRLDEVGEVIGVTTRGLALTDDPPLGVHVLPTAVQQQQRATLPEEFDPDTGPMGSPRIAAVTFPGDLARAEVEGGHDRVRRLLVVLEVVPATGATDPDGAIHPEAPTGQVEEMRSVVGQLAAAPVPAPVPVVVDHVVEVGPLRRRPLPERVVEPVRHRCRAPVPDARAVGMVPASGGMRLADDPAVQEIHHLADHRPAAALVAHLDPPPVLPRGRHHPLRLAGVVAARLLHIDVLAGIAGEDRRRGMPVVRCGNADRVDGGVVEHPSEIDHLTGAPARLLLDPFGRLGGRPPVHVAHRADLTAGNGEEPLEVGLATVQPHHAHGHPVSRRLGPERGAERRGGGEPGDAADEVSTGNGWEIHRPSGARFEGDVQITFRCRHLAARGASANALSRRRGPWG